MDQLLKNRFKELDDQLAVVESTLKIVHSDYVGSYNAVDSDLFLGWCAKVRNLLSIIYGSDSTHFLEFKEAEKPTFMSSNYDVLKKVRAIFIAAKEDFESGLITINSPLDPEIPVPTLSQDTQVQQFKLPPLDALTPRWLWDNVPMRYWIAYLVFLISAFILGVQASRLGWVREIFRL